LLRQPVFELEKYGPGTLRFFLNFRWIPGGKPVLDFEMLGKDGFGIA
jgi:hypothetical protein